VKDFDERGRGSLWEVTSDHPKAPTYRGKVFAHRDIREGEELELSLWPNKSDNPKAPQIRAQLKDKYVKDERQESQPARDDFYDDNIPFAWPLFPIAGMLAQWLNVGGIV
jgi:hypothetical protein